MVQHDWVVDVLNDLEAYAKKNELFSLSAELVRTRKIALAEIDFDAHFTTKAVPLVRTVSRLR